MMVGKIRVGGMFVSAESGLVLSDDDLVLTASIPTLFPQGVDGQQVKGTAKNAERGLLSLLIL
jgi:hypothetical protein